MARNEVSITALAAAISGTLSVIYLGTYWNRFYVNPFPALSLNQLAVYSVSNLAGTLLLWGSLYLLSYASNFLAGYTARLHYERRIREDEHNSLEDFGTPPGRRRVIPPLPSALWKTAFLLSSSYLSIEISIRLIETGPAASFLSLPPDLSSAIFTAATIIAMLSILRYRSSMPEVSRQLSLIYVGVVIIPLISQLAFGRAQDVWNGGNIARIQTSFGLSGTYGYIGQTGDKTYLLSSTGNERAASRILSLPTSTIELIQPKGTGSVFKFGP